jgi:hypothetical protein
MSPKTESKKKSVPVEKPKRTRERRTRPTPKLLTEANEKNEVGKRRTLLVLSVLSGQRTVSDVIEESKMTRQSYYNMETRAVMVMLRELGASGGLTAEYRRAQQEVREQELRIERLLEDKRRLEHLLMVTRRLVKTGPMTLAKGGRPRRTQTTAELHSTESPSSKERSTTATTVDSTPTKAFGGES